MSFLFPLHKSTKKPAELVKIVRDALVHGFNTSSSKSDKTDEAHFTKYMLQIKAITTGPADDSQQEAVLTVAREAVSGEEPTLLRLFSSKLSIMGFEVRKDVVVVFNALLRVKVDGVSLAVSYLERNCNLLDDLVLGYENSNIALNCGAVLRECLHYEKLAAHLLKSPVFYSFFKWLELKAFEIASDAFATFKELLTHQKGVVHEFLEANFDPFFNAYDLLLASDNYVTRRLSLKLLGELLLDRSNTTIMVKYINNPEKLKLMMNLLKDNSRNIQFEAFHVFKVFVANPNKAQPVLLLLYRNRDKLLRYLADFHSDRDDEEFLEERQVLCRVLQQMKDPEAPAT